MNVTITRTGNNINNRETPNNSKNIYEYMRPIIVVGYLTCSEFLEWDSITKTIVEKRGFRSYYKNIIFGILYVLAVIEAFPSLPPGKEITIPSIVYGIECSSIAFLVPALWISFYFTQKVHLKLYQLIEETDELIRNFNIDLSSRKIDGYSRSWANYYYIISMMPLPYLAVAYSYNTYQRKAIFLKYPLGMIVFYRLVIIRGMLRRIGDRTRAINETLHAASNKIEFLSKNRGVDLIELLRNLGKAILKQYNLIKIFTNERQFEHFLISSLSAGELFINLVYWTQLIFFGTPTTKATVITQTYILVSVLTFFFNTMKICEDQRDETLETGRLVHRLYLSIDDKSEIREEIESLSFMLLQHQVKFSMYDLYYFCPAYALRMLLGVLGFVALFVQFRIYV